MRTQSWSLASAPELSTQVRGRFPTNHRTSVPGEAGASLFKTAAFGFSTQQFLGAN